jgi:non-ribosomal peptide synthetase component E (peptide arylation enzyme)
VLLPQFKPDDLASVVEKQRPTALWAAPAHVAACRAAGLFDRHDWSSLKLAIVSGSMAPPGLITHFSQKLPGCAVTQLWGMTELQVRGPLMFCGYFNNEEANRSAFTPDGWFRSGDLAELRAGGNIAITGRTKDIINRGGVKFNPADVEMLLDSHPRILRSAIVPMPDPVLGERACAFVTLKANASPPTLEELVAYLLNHQIAKTKLPEKLVVVPEMPLTPTRKIIKGKLPIP